MKFTNYFLISNKKERQKRKTYSNLISGNKSHEIIREGRIGHKIWSSVELSAIYPRT